MSEGPILHLYKYGRKTELHTDACKQGRLCKKGANYSRIARWALQLEEFDYETEHRAGSRMKHVDALSRYPVMMVCNDTLTSKLKKAQEEDDNIQTFKSLLEKQESEEFFERNGILYKYLNGRELIVTPKAMQAELIKLIHENGHFSVGKTEEIVKQEFFIPNLSNVVKKCPRKLKQQQKTFGNPIRIISDRGSAFTSKLFNDFCDEENIQHLQIATGVPRGNGQVERIHRTLIPVLTKLSLDDSTKWYKYVDRLQRILNSTISRSTKWTPFELLVGIKMRNKEDIVIKDLLLEEMAKELLEQREFLRNDAKRTSKPYSLKIERRITEEERKLRYTKKNQYRSRKRKFKGNQYRNKRSSIDTQTKKDTTVASNIEPKTASASKLEDLKDNFLESSGNSDEIFGHRIFDVTTLLSMFVVLCCPVCLHDELSLTEDSRYGICLNFSLKCRNCDFLKGFTSSEKINNKFKLNTVISFALRVFGKGYTAGNKQFVMLDLPFLSKTAFRNQELKIQQAASIVSIESMRNAATEVKKLKNSPLESISCCGVSLDGTWQKHDYSSHNGCCVCCISIDTGKILDIEIMSQFCRICSKKTKVPDAASNAHVCCNHMGSASSMETVGAYRIFERSENHR
ncbi:retrovirus-related Pol polyprotein from transposon 17.6 [Trichonephila clavipes]|nr:retrovirus-related Pol polyprotein from transposon 17.6 [Trichonephila clavipes]